MRRWLARLAVPAAVFAAGLFSLTPAAWAAAPTPVKQTVDWSNHRGTNADGTCANVGTSDDLHPAAGQEGWLFILTSPFDGTGSSLTFTFDPANVVPPDTASPVAGVQQGGGSYHFVVYSELGAKLVSASATNGTQTSILTVSHCTDGSSTPPSTPPPPTKSLTSEVQLANNKVIDDGSNPGTAPADVHDSVTLTVTGLDGWSGTITETFYHTNNCDSTVIDSTTVDVDQSTTMPINILPETGLPAGEYSYQAMFVDKNNDVLSTNGVCEPFKIVAGPPTTTTPGTPTTTPPGGGNLPTTGVAITGYVLAGLALIGGGIGALMIARRRHDAKATTL